MSTAFAYTATLERRTMGEVDFVIAVVPIEISEQLLARPSGTRVYASYDGGDLDQTRLLPLGDGAGYYLLLSAEKRRGLGLDVGDRVEVQLAPDASDYGIPVPEEWQAHVDEDAAVRAAFDELTPGRQRRILYVVGKPKGAATRERKAAGAAAYLREVGAEFDYQGLLAFLKADR